MGYMGFGMQKWIYTQRARRPFTRIRQKADFESGFIVPDASVSTYLYYVNHSGTSSANHAKLKFHDKLDPYPMDIIFYCALLPLMVVIAVTTLILHFLVI